MRLVLVFFALFILGCGGGEEPTVTPEPTRTPVAQDSVVTPVPTVIPTETPILAAVLIPQPVSDLFRTAISGEEIIPSAFPEATSTPIILTLNPSNIILEIPPTPTPTPTAVPTPTATATPTPPTPTPTPVILVGTVDVHLTLPIAPNGVAGYIFDVVVGPHVSLIDFKTVFSLSERVGNRIAAVDLVGVVEAGATDVIVGTITFEAVSPGFGPIQINIFQFDDDDGLPINAQFDPGFIEVR